MIMKNYTTPEIEIKKFEVEEVITASGGTVGGVGGDYELPPDTD